MFRVIRMILVLTAIGVLSGTVLAGVAKRARPKIEENREEELRRAIFVVLPEAKSYKELSVNGVRAYEGLDADGKPTGVALIGEGGGFQGKIKLIVGLNNRLTRVKGMKVLESVETPGLGGKIHERKFQDQFAGLPTDMRIEYVKNKKPEKPNQVEAITGATISSRSVVKIINENIFGILDELKSRR